MALSTPLQPPPPPERVLHDRRHLLATRGFLYLVAGLIFLALPRVMLESVSPGTAPKGQTSVAHVVGLLVSCVQCVSSSIQIMLAAEENINESWSEREEKENPGHFAFPFALTIAGGRSVCVYHLPL